MMSENVEVLESKRLALQSTLDGERTQEERNRFGQFATPTPLAIDILRYAEKLLPKEQAVHFLDPAIGSGAFFSALMSVFSKTRIMEAVGYEIDNDYAAAAKELWRGSGLDVRIADFTRQRPENRFNLIICNPPYVRHHHLSDNEKGRLQKFTYESCGSRIGGLAGLYCYFLGIADAWLADQGIAGWLVPSEFMDVNYGKEVKRYLLDQRLTLLHIHRFDPQDVQFADALVSSAVVWFQRKPAPKNHHITFTLGGSLTDPKLKREVSSTTLATESKWSRFPAKEIRDKNLDPTIGDLFKIKRGLATGDNSYFILTEKRISDLNLPMAVFRPILPGARQLPTDEIKADEKGWPVLETRLFLLDPRMSEEEIQSRYPTLWNYLLEGKARGLDTRYLCRHRTPWYTQENRPPPPLICTYMARQKSAERRPFRFLLNLSQATVANVYLAMYPKPEIAPVLQNDTKLIRTVWELLNQLTPDQLLSEGRVYGGGLHKLEPKELANVPVPHIARLFPKFSEKAQDDFFEVSRRSA